jgi:hypothetical protein
VVGAGGFLAVFADGRRANSAGAKFSAGENRPMQSRRGKFYKNKTPESWNDQK